MLFTIPLTIVPLIAYNLFAWGLFGAGGGDPWLAPLFTVEMLSGARFTMTSGDLMLVIGIVLLFVEILKATRTGNASLADHVLSMLVFVAYLVEFLIAAPAAHSVFVILTVIAFVDVVAGFTITIRGARRDIGWG
ncbi:hypothetical protein [Oharaeibacter diazotrophicus]|uniref:Transmembrane protein n=1 Tax=Oharaeibacter diazotrophicus TaxID=1920512 RepID=A0A4R6RDC6_9HYPH|nr:hypothetical protein [Oharaeibacter diazotrophicus]TDP84094.1 hypothetical protein EDD54_2697 [Oharaeibacter diazotrophicus]BBE73133.1 hypothetical protein OHA_1_02739 [Pleomorphomonas sp. SM30]GLS74922.1 hypothetical protein GCM10007904_02570 [Oharaeibacter diazotrophicus]